VITENLHAADRSALRKHEAYRSRILPGARDLIVYLPPSYDSQPGRRFPVLYLQDGQNIFDPATSFAGVAWDVREAADRLTSETKIRALVIVGIYNTGKQRVREYTPSRAPKLGGGGADRYGRMLLDEIKPFIESQYRILAGPANTGLGGSSLGGLLTIYLGLRYPNVFGKLAALSPSVWWNQRWILGYVSRARLKSRPRIWLDTGTQEGAHTTADVRKLRDALHQKGWQDGRDLHYEEIQGGQHNESAWAQRVAPFLQFLFPAGESEV
jgi:predicted alpha/beta superfamily hydrolase